MIQTKIVIRRELLFACFVISIAITVISLSQTVFAQSDRSSEQTRALLLSGTAFEGKLLATDAKWGLSFKTDDGERKVAAEDLLRWGRPGKLRRGPIAVLRDGGLLRADALDYDGSVVKIQSALFGDVDLDGELVAGIVFELPVDTADADRLLDWTAASNRLEPRTAFRKADTASGRVRLLNGDMLSGRLQRIDEDNVHVETEVGPVATDLGRVGAIRFSGMLGDGNAASDGNEMKAWIGLADGSLLLAKKLVLDSRKLAVSLCANHSNDKSDWITSPQELVFLQPIGPKAVYLSDLRDAEYRHVPYLELSWPYGLDRNASGGRLRCGGRLFIKGLGVHSSARLTYLLDQSFSRFEAGTAVDDSAGGRGSVRFRVYVDGKKKYSGQIVRGRDLPVPVSVDIRGAKRIDLIVDFADRAGQEDRADWLEARLVR